jgi:site-specific recombinase XerD
MIINYYLRKDKPKNGLLPIYMEIKLQGKRSRQTTGYYILPKQWDETSQQVKSHPIKDEINTDLIDRKKKLMGQIVDARVQNKRITTKDLNTDFFTFADDMIASYRNKRKPGTLSNYEKHLRKLEDFVGIRLLPIEDITHEFLINFENWIAENRNARKDNTNYAHAILKTIRRVFTLAEKKGYHNPFKGYEMPEYTAGDKDHLTVQELDKWTKFYKETKDDYLKEAALYFLFGCYTGLRISDWYLFNYRKQVHKDHVALRAKKNGEWITIPLHNRLKFVLSEMRTLPLESQEILLNRRFKDISEELELNKSISSHCGRKSFAVTMCLERGISSETAAELMGITLSTFVNAYSRVTPFKIKAETTKAWGKL